MLQFIDSPTRPAMPHQLIPVDASTDILPQYRDTPIESLLRYHNLGEPLPPTTGHAHLLIAMCMDHRKELVIPNEFAYVLRSAGGNLRESEFEVAYAIAVGGVDTIALLAHTDCGMSVVLSKREAFINGLVARAGWTADSAAEHFDDYARRHHIGDAVDFVVDEATRMRALFPSIRVAPLLYRVDSDRLVQVQ
jgi:carbonic anhydrase